MPELPVLLLSGYARAMLGEDLDGLGMGFLSKPYSPAELVAAVAAAWVERAGATV
jgi:DNA-binding response OmpR family regulator